MIHFTDKNIKGVIKYLMPLMDKGWNITHIKTLETQTLKILKGNEVATVNMGNYLLFNSAGDLLIYDTYPGKPPKEEIPELIQKFENALSACIKEKMNFGNSMKLVEGLLGVEVEVRRNHRVKVGPYIVTVKLDKNGLKCSEVVEYEE